MNPPAGSVSEFALPWLRGLRWSAVAGQGLCVLLVSEHLQIPLPLKPVFALIGLTALTNLALHLVPSRHAKSPGGIAAVLLFDVLSLTALLHLTGGPHNPFSSFYLVHVAIAAVALPTAWTVGVGVACCAGFASLFLGYRDPLPGTDVRHLPIVGETICGVGPQMSVALHLQGMLASFALTAAAIVTFAGRLQNALRRREAELARANALAAQSDRFAALATLAGGAAHELGTPLGTIGIAAAELARAARRHPDDTDLAEDADLIREEVARCRAILDRLANQAGDPAETLALPEVLGEVRARFAQERLVVQDDSETATLVAPRQALVQALVSLVKNAFDASPPGRAVELTATRADHRIEFHVTDRGSGLDEAARRHAGEPFFTTKPPGRGVGLGLYLVRLLAQRLGGEFDLAPQHGGGTRAVLRLPRP